MIHRLLLLLATTLLLSFGQPASADQPAINATTSCQSNPLDGDLILPAPGELCLVFRPVGIGEGSEFYAQKKFLIGDPDNGYKGSPVTLTLSGHFLSEGQGEMGTDDWIYYVGKYEVTEAQYYAVMGLPQGADPALATSQYPIANVSYFDALDFINRLNTWLFAHAMEKLPNQWGTPGYIRLPTEAEWEFAARGGTMARAETFSNRHPYGDNLAGHEWFAGPSSSHNKVQPVGTLKPNVLGIHDMLGNVSELIASPYYIEYFQGRGGGLTARGGHFFTSEKSLHSSLRTEEPVYIGNAEQGMRANAKATMGFRLVIATPVLAGREALNLADAGWEQYRSGVGAQMPAALSTAPIEAQMDVKVEDAEQYLARVRRFVDGSGEVSLETAQKDIGYLAAALQDAKKIRRQAEEENALAFVRTASFAGFQACREISKVTLLDAALKEGPNPLLQQRRDELEANIQEMLSTYYLNIERLSTLTEGIQKKAFEKHKIYLLGVNNRQQADFTAITQRQAQEFRKNKRADVFSWQKELSNWAEIHLIKKI